MMINSSSPLEYEYSGLLARTWDLFRGDTSRWEDRFLFLSLVREWGQPVLDVGCGTGRILLDFLALGIDIDGVDLSPQMLTLCREKAARLGLSPSLAQQKMEALSPHRPYRTILVPSSSFQLVTDPSLALQAMARFHQHLIPGGALVMPFMVLRQAGEPDLQDWQLAKEKTRPEDGAVVRRWSTSRYDPVTQLEHTEDRYEVTFAGRVIQEERHRRSPATREYSQDQALDLYHQAGFDPIRVYSGFSRDPAQNGDTLFTVVGVKTAA